MLDLVGKGLDVVQKDAQSTNDKVETLHRAKDKGFRGGNYNDHSKSSRSFREERREGHERNKREERHKRCYKGEEDRKDELDMGKCKIPQFVGNHNPKVYIDWELKVEQTFVPLSYARNLHHKLQRLYLGSKSVEEYHKEIEIELLRAQLRESEEATMERFLHGLNKDIQDMVELGIDREKEKFRRARSPKKRNEPFQGQKKIVVTPSSNAPRTRVITKTILFVMFVKKADNLSIVKILTKEIEKERESPLEEVVHVVGKGEINVDRVNKKVEKEFEAHYSISKIYDPLRNFSY
ncbi:hypothetical protein CR513_02282, partial [Mucuna pruriens]